MVIPHFDDTIKVIGVDADGKKYDKGIIINHRNLILLVLYSFLWLNFFQQIGCPFDLFLV